LTGVTGSNHLWSRVAVRHDAFASYLDQAGVLPLGADAASSYKPWPDSILRFASIEPRSRLSAALDQLSRPENLLVREFFEALEAATPR